MHRVLITAVGGNVGQGVVKALRAASRRFFIIGIDMEARSAGFSLVDRAVVTPSVSDPALTGVLIDLIRAERIEAVFVCSPAELAFFSQARAQLEAATPVRVLINPERVLRIGRDKLETARFLEARGFCYPATEPATNRAAVQRLIDRFGFPAIVKPRCGWTSAHVFRVDSPQALEAAAVLVPDPIVQRYLPDDSGEYTAGVVGSARAGTFAPIVLKRELTQGTTYRTELASQPAIDDAIVAVAAALGIDGVCNFQFRLVDGNPVIFEINPRFSGTSGIRYLYGFNDAEMVFEQVCLNLPTRRPPLHPAVVLRYWNEIYIAAMDFADMRSAAAITGKVVG